MKRLHSVDNLMLFLSVLVVLHHVRIGNGEYSALLSHRFRFKLSTLRGSNRNQRFFLDLS